MRLRARIAMLMLIGLVLVTTGCTPALMAIQTEFAARGATEAEQEDAVQIAACESGGGDPLSIQPQVVSNGNYGMFQINWTAQRNRVAKLGFSKEQLLDPDGERAGRRGSLDGPRPSFRHDRRMVVRAHHRRALRPTPKRSRSREPSEVTADATEIAGGCVSPSRRPRRARRPTTCAQGAACDTA